MSPYADVVIRNARAFTSDEFNPRAEALAIIRNRIAFVGSSSDAEAWCGPETKVIDAHGNTLLPGFIDSHFHLLWGCIWLGSAQLQDVKNKSDLKEVLLEFAGANKTTPWVDGRGIKYGIVSKA